MAISDLDDAGIALMDEELSNVSKRLRLNTSTDNGKYKYRLSPYQSLLSNTSGVTKELDFRFRMCVAYLIDILLAKNCSSRIKFDILELLTSTIRSLSKLPNGKAIKMRLNKIIEKNYSNTKNVPTVAAREATDALTKIHELSLSTSEADTIRSYGEISLFILKVVKVSSKLRSNQSSNNLENHGYEPEVADSLCDIYKDTLSKFLGSNKSKLRAHFFESFIRRSPELSWRLLPLIMDFIISNKLSKHRLVCAYRMLEILLRIHSGNKDPKFMDIIKGLGPEFIAVAQEEIDKMRTHTKEGQGNNNTSRKKLMIRCIKLFRHKCRPAGKERSGSPNRYEKRNKQPELIISNSDTPPVTAYSHSA